MTVRHRIAAALERGIPVAAPLAMAWTPFAARGLTRPLRRPIRNGVVIPIVCVGGATLGGSGKTRVALACARALQGLGARVALVGHAYRATVGTARVVPRHGALATFGDEALVCARGFDGDVIVGPSRQAAVDLAGERANVIVLDGPLRVPGPDVLSILAVDEDEPWGSGAVVPAGDLRASRKALLRVADHVVRVSATPSLGERAVPASGPLGLFTAIARPARLVAALARLGIHPSPIVSIDDHGPLDAAASIRITPDRAWLATDKCALHLAGTHVRIVELMSMIALPSNVLVDLADLSRVGLSPTVGTP